MSTTLSACLGYTCSYTCNPRYSIRPFPVKKKRVALLPIPYVTVSRKESPDVTFFLKSMTKQGKVIHIGCYTCSCTCNTSKVSVWPFVNPMVGGGTVTGAYLQAPTVSHNVASRQKYPESLVPAAGFTVEDSPPKGKADAVRVSPRDTVSPPRAPRRSPRSVCHYIYR